MKRMAIILRWALIGGVLSAAGGCRKNFMSINTDPDVISSSQINFNYLFTNAELQTSGNTDGNGYEDWRNNLIYSSCMIQHLSSTEFYWDGDKYLYSAPYNSAYWDENYPNAIANMAEVMQHTMNDGSQANFYQICRIFRVFMFQRMTDMYGDCPYFQAGLGFISGITAPVYDKQQDIYTDMLEELEDAANRLNPQAANTVGKADLLYGGDVGAWQRFAYSEMTRLAMRLAKVDPDMARQWVTIAAGGGVFRGNIDNAIVPHQNVTGTPVVSGTGLILIGNDPNGYRLSQTFVSFLRNSGDPRLPYLATVCSNPDSAADMGDTTAADQLGQPNGFDEPNSGTPFDLTLASGWPGNQNSYSLVNRYTFARLDAPTFSSPTARPSCCWRRRRPGAGSAATRQPIIPRAYRAPCSNWPPRQAQGHAIPRSSPGCKLILTIRTLVFSRSTNNTGWLASWMKMNVLPIGAGVGTRS